MAPRLIARSFAFLQPGGERRRRKASETDRDLARNTETARAFVHKTDLCHSSRVKGAVARVVPDRAKRIPTRQPATQLATPGATLGGRLAQLVRALP
jgi:hypothetical protein